MQDMDSGLYAAYTALLSRTDALDIAANNLANTGTAGFHAERASFKGVLAEAQGAMPSQVGSAVNSYSALIGRHVSDVQGTITATGNPLDLAIAGHGYFSVKTPQGNRYTRDGEFQVSNAGLLTTKTGEPVLDASGKSLALPTGDVQVSGDGTVSVANADGSAIVGRIAMTDLGAGGAVQAETATLFKAADGAIPAPATDASIQQGAIEGANLDAVQGTVQLLTIQRQAEMMQRALSVFHNDFDKTASEELARV